MNAKVKKLSLITLFLCFITCFATALAIGVNSLFALADGEGVQTGMSITLKDDVTINCYASGIDAQYGEAQMKFVYRESEYVQTATVENGNAVFKFNKVTPQYFTEQVSAQLMLGGVEVGEEQTFSVESYCLSLLNGTAQSLNISQEKYDMLKPLVVDLLYYGEEAQNYLQINTDALATANLSAEQKALKTEYTEVDSTDLSFDAPTAESQIAWTSVGLKFDYNVSMYVKFALKTAPQGDLTVAFAKGESAPVSVVATADGENSGYVVYKATFTDISATEFDKVITATVLDGQTQVGTPLTYSIKSFAYSKQADAVLGGLAKATYNYGKSACAYASFAEITGIELPQTITVYDVYQDVAPEINGFNLVVKYDNGTSEEVDVALAEVDVDGITDQTTAINLTYKDKTVSLPVNVIAHTGIGAHDGWYKSYYKDGETFNKGGLKVGYAYPDGAVKGDLEYTVDTQTKLNVTSQTVQIASAGYTADLPVHVVSANASVTVEAEHANIGGTIATVTSGGTISAASNRSYLRNFKKNSTATFKVISTVASTGSIRFYLASHEDGYEGSLTTTYPLNPSEYLIVTLNGTQIPFGKYEILPSTSSDNVATRLCNWYVVTFDGVSLKAGQNTIVLKSLEDMSTDNKANLHSTAFDKIEVLYANADATPGKAIEIDGAKVDYEVEYAHLLNIGVTKKSYGNNSQLYNYMSGSNPGFARDIASGGKIAFNVNSSEVQNVKLSMHASSTQGADVKLSDLIKSITVNGTEVNAVTLEESIPANDKSLQAMATFAEVEIATLLLCEGNNSIVINLEACNQVFIDKFSVAPFTIDTFETITYQAEKATLSGITTVAKANGASSGLFTYMQQAGDTAPGFVKNFKAGSTLTIVIESATARKVKIAMWGSSTSNAVMKASTLINKITFNGTDSTLADGTCFPTWGSLSGAQAMANWQEYSFGEFDLVAGANTFTITFNATEGAFVDRLVVSPVAE